MSEMVERVARALAKQDFSCSWEQLASHYRDSYWGSAKAAIEAMREPTEAMSDQIIFSDAKSIPEGEKLFRAMIDAALCEASGISPDLKVSQRPTVSSETNSLTKGTEPGAVTDGREMPKAAQDLSLKHDWCPACHRGWSWRDPNARPRTESFGGVESRHAGNETQATGSAVPGVPPCQGDTISPTVLQAVGLATDPKDTSRRPLKEFHR